MTNTISSDVKAELAIEYLVEVWDGTYADELRREDIDNAIDALVTRQAELTAMNERVPGSAGDLYGEDIKTYTEMRDALAERGLIAH